MTKLIKVSLGINILLSILLILVMVWFISTVNTLKEQQINVEDMSFFFERFEERQVQILDDLLFFE